MRYIWCRKLISESLSHDNFIIHPFQTAQPKKFAHDICAAKIPEVALLLFVNLTRQLLEKRKNKFKRNKKRIHKTVVLLQDNRIFPNWILYNLQNP